jgi:hypothetical protein
VARSSASIPKSVSINPAVGPPGRDLDIEAYRIRNIDELNLPPVRRANEIVRNKVFCEFYTHSDSFDSRGEGGPMARIVINLVPSGEVQ